ncbi:hypothetical protein B2J88_44760, partial [Rhodococcus sp. SRB_17]|nr:hypothetical protein [Rhodococcus sp. SRB_17]
PGNAGHGDRGDSSDSGCGDGYPAATGLSMMVLRMGDLLARGRGPAGPDINESMGGKLGAR